MVKYGDSGRAYRRQPSPPLASSNWSMPFWFYFYPRPPSLLLRLFRSIKRKSRTSCQPIALALGHSVLVDRKNFRELVKIVQIAEDDHENFGEARVAWRVSRAIGWATHHSDKIWTRSTNYTKFPGIEWIINELPMKCLHKPEHELKWWAESSE